jgi:sugar phosphate permease
MTAGAVSVASAVLVAILYRNPAKGPTAEPTHRPRLLELTSFLKRPDVLTVFVCGLLLSMAQSSVLAYLVLYATEALLVSVVAAGQLLALAQIGGTAGRLGWGFASDRFLGGRRRPGVVINSLIAAAAYAALAFCGQLSPGVAALISLVVGAGALGWVGLYFALVAEIGGTRYAGLLTGASVVFAWSGVLMGPPLFGLAREWSGSYRLPWLLIAGLAVLAAALLWRRPPVRRPQSSAS